MLTVHFADVTLQTAASFAMIAIVVGLLVYLKDRVPDAVLWFSLFAVMLIPVFYFKGISYAFVAERYLYIPSFAILMLVVSLMTTASPLRGKLNVLWAIVLVF